MTRATRVPAEVWPLASFLGEEMEARGWTTEDVAMRMGTRTLDRDLLIVMLVLAVQKNGLTIDDKTLKGLGRAFDVDPGFLRNMDAAWHSAPAAARHTYEPPDHLYGPLARSCFHAEPDNG